MINYQQYISMDSHIRFGKPVINGTRISVYDVMGWLASGMSQQEILEDFPELDKASIQACFAFVAERENRLRVHYEAVV